MDKKFNTLLSICIIPQIIELIINNKLGNLQEAIVTFYKSKTYELLSDENTKFWHYSLLTLYMIWESEEDLGKLILIENGLIYE